MTQAEALAAAQKGGGATLQNEQKKVLAETQAQEAAKAALVNRSGAVAASPEAIQAAARRGTALKAIGSSDEKTLQDLARGDIAQKAKTAAEARNPGPYKVGTIGDEYNPETNFFGKSPEAMAVNEAGMIAPESGAPTYRTSQTNYENADKTPKTDAGMNATVSGAKALTGASPANVGTVIAKLKEEEKKGGPNVFDIIEAASAGWGGRVPAYVQRKMEQEAAQAEVDKMGKAAELNKQAMADEFANQVKLENMGINAQKELALMEMGGGAGAVPGGSKLNALQFAGVK